LKEAFPIIHMLEALSKATLNLAVAHVHGVRAVSTRGNERVVTLACEVRGVRRVRYPHHHDAPTTFVAARNVVEFNADDWRPNLRIRDPEDSLLFGGRPRYRNDLAGGICGPTLLDPEHNPPATAICHGGDIFRGFFIPVRLTRIVDSLFPVQITGFFDSMINCLLDQIDRCVPGFESQGSMDGCKHETPPHEFD